MDGWIKLHRKLIEWEWYKDNNVKIVFLHLLLTANHKDKKWKGQIVNRGQKLTSTEHLAEETNLTIMQVRTALKKLKSTNEITTKVTSKNTLITIEKYNDYQCMIEENNKQNNIQDNNEITNKQQANNKQITTNKNEKNIKNDKNERNNNYSCSRVGESCIDGLQENDSRIDGFQAIIDFYNNNIGLLTPYGLEVLSDYAKDMSCDLIILAMQNSVEANKKTIKYIKGILNNWEKQGIKTVLEAQEESENFRNRNATVVVKRETQEEKNARRLKEMEEAF